ncbi:MAG TPA: CinA family protein [Pirellulaceae bacterium]|jgi:PncC family amidohydrolase
MSVAAVARRVARLLRTREVKVVFAESCTGGLVSGALTAVPGISDFHCGGVVVYRNATKTAYLGIPADVLQKPGPVSAEVAELMAIRILEKTPEADAAISVTGHLGPHAPARLDGRVYSAVAWRDKDRNSARFRVKTTRFQCNKADSRLQRQRWVVQQVLELLGRELEAADDL